MADIFVSYTSSDREWAFWIGQELEALGHTPHLHDWEIDGGGDIAGWMEERHHKAERVLCVISRAYLAAPYSNWERRAAHWAAQSKRPNFSLPVLVEACELPTLLAHVKHCSLHELSEAEARDQLSQYLLPAVKPAGPFIFPGAKTGATDHAPAAFPGVPTELMEQPKNIPARLKGPPKPGPVIVADDLQKGRWGDWRGGMVESYVL